MIEVRPIMNTSAEEVLSFKTCCGLRMHGQNLEIHLVNHGDRTVVIRGYFDMDGEHGTKRITKLLPPGDIIVPPGETVACYCQMDEAEWNRSRSLAFFDADGTRYDVSIA
jgi:hypothetical protein